MIILFVTVLNNKLCLQITLFAIIPFNFPILRNIKCKIKMLTFRMLIRISAVYAQVNLFTSGTLVEHASGQFHEACSTPTHTIVRLNRKSLPHSWS